MTTHVSTKSALFWASLDKVLTNGFALVISILLARLIAPSEFGIIATAMILTVLLSLFVEPGMTSALIQNKETKEIDYSTILFFNICTGGLLYLFLYIVSPFIAIWFDLPVLKDVLRVMGIQILIGGINSVQISYVQKHMMFQKFFACSLLSTIVASVIAIMMAYAGYGVWSLVANNLLRSFILLITVSISLKWHFSLKFSYERFREMFPFASKMLFAKFIDQGYVEVIQTIISKVFSPTDLAFYNRGKSFPDMLISNINSALGNVLFPIFSNIQDNEKQLKESIKNAVSMTSYICFPLLIGLLACANNLILAVLTEKWESCIIYLQIICLYYLWVPFSNIVWQSFKGIGNSNKVLQLEVIKISLNIILLIAFIFILKSPLSIAISLACSYFLSFIVENIYVVKYIRISFKELFKCYFPSLLISSLMGVIVYSLGSISNSPFICLLVQVFVGICTYILISISMNIPQYKTLKSILYKK